MSPASPDQSAEMASDLNPARRLAWTQDHGDRAGAFGVIDVDRQETPFIVIGVEQRQLLAAMNDVNAVVDVEGDSLGFLSIACHPLVDQRIDQANDFAEVKRILQT